MKISKIALTAVPAAFLLATTAQATTLVVTNPSFETLPAGGLPNSCGTSCSFDVGAIPGWTNSGSSGQLQPNTALLTTKSSDGTSTIAYTDGGTISQTVVDTVQNGIVYTLMVDLGFRNDLSFTGTADLLINGNKYTATGVTPTRGNWSTFTALYTGNSTDAGKAITIELNGAGQQGDFDNVRLSNSVVTATPEPASLTLVGFSLLTLVQRLRRKRT